MKRVAINTYYGEIIHLPVDSAGRYRCPVCGYDWGDVAPYFRGGGPSFDICSGCKTEFGCDDEPGNLPDGSPDFPKWEDRLARLRQDWLDSQSWSKAALAQVWEGLELTEKGLAEESRKIRQARGGPARTITLAEIRAMVDKQELARAFRDDRLVLAAGPGLAEDIQTLEPNQAELVLVLLDKEHGGQTPPEVVAALLRSSRADLRFLGGRALMRVSRMTDDLRIAICMAADDDQASDFTILLVQRLAWLSQQWSPTGQIRADAALPRDTGGSPA